MKQSCNRKVKRGPSSPLYFGVSADDEALALRADGDEADVAADGLFNVFDVAAGGFGKVLPITRAGDVALPAGQILDDGLGVLQQHGEREVVGLLAV